MAMRLVTSVTLSASRRERVKDNAYLNISEAPAWAAAGAAAGDGPSFGDGHCCAMPAASRRHRARGARSPGSKAIAATWRTCWTSRRPGSARRSCRSAIRRIRSPRHPPRGSRTEAEALWRDIAAKEGIDLGIGPWCEDRPVYSSNAFAIGLRAGQRRSLHLGLDLFAPAGTAVRTPLDGTVVDLFETDLPLDYGHAVLLRHEPEPGLAFHSLWGHLSAQTIRDRKIGEQLEAGAGRSAGWASRGRTAIGSRMCISS